MKNIKLKLRNINKIGPKGLWFQGIKQTVELFQVAKDVTV